MNTVIKVERKVALLNLGLIMEEKNLLGVILMMDMMGKLLNGMKMVKNIENKIIIMGKEMV